MSRKRLYKVTVAIVVCAYAVLCGCGFWPFGKKSGDIKPHLIEEHQAETTPLRPIDSLPSKPLRSQSLLAQLDELTEMTYADGSAHKPDLTNARPEVRQTYEAAVAVCDRYIRNDFTSFERLHALHDYLAYYTAYDFDLLESGESVGADAHPSFRADGVFLHKKAVCDGISKAFMLLCGIQQIPCIRVTGEYTQDGNTQRHAWNKVKLDGNWYNVDVTMDVLHMYVDNDRVDLLNHGYFLVSDEKISDPLTGRHTRSGNDPVDYACTHDYDFYDALSLGLGDYSMKITNQRDLEEVFTLVKKSKRSVGKIELQLAYPEMDAVNLSREEAYASQIAAAYKKVKDADFSVNAAAKIYPYHRYPNGVFVFFIYR